MTLSKGDRLVIQRDGKALTSESGEGYYLYEVMDQVNYENLSSEGETFVNVRLKVID